MQLLGSATDPADAATNACAQELLDALPSVMRYVRKEMRTHRNKGLSLPQFRTLAFLVTEKVVNLSAVSDFLGTTLPTASRIVTGLVDKGFVLRHECHNDRRHVDLAATAKGAAIMESARSATRAKLASELSSLSQADIRIVERAMALLHDAFGPGSRAGGAGGCGGDVQRRSRSRKTGRLE